MKTKKTLKRLKKVVALLSNVIDRLPGSKGGLENLLDSESKCRSGDEVGAFAAFKRCTQTQAASER
jgi:hypothetical protein